MAWGTPLPFIHNTTFLSYPWRGSREGLIDGRKEGRNDFFLLDWRENFLIRLVCFFLLERGNDSPVFFFLLFLVLWIDDPPAFFGFGSNGIG